jgi:hypothetical protein
MEFSRRKGNNNFCFIRKQTDEKKTPRRFTQNLPDKRSCFFGIRRVDAARLTCQTDP